VLLDIAGQQGVPALPEDFEIRPEHLDQAARGLEIGRGDVVLLRTGWAQHFSDPPRFIAEGRGPGPSLAGAQWLSGRGVFAAGADTMAFEKIPVTTMPVHVHLLVESGIHIMECLNMEEIAAAGVREFLFVAAPMKIRGATGAPMRPLALVE
jgi:kynurenine formamidase